MKLWDKGYTIHNVVDRFTVGKDRELDLELARYDVAGSRAHAEMLGTVGILTEAEVADLTAALDELAAEIEAGNFRIEADFEDVHSKVEHELVERVGEAGKKIHTARSRNDQVLVDLHLYAKAELQTLMAGVEQLFETLIALADRHTERCVVVPAERLRGRVHDHVDARHVERSLHDRRGERRVDHQGKTVAMGDFGDGLNVHDLDARVPERLAIDEPGVFGDRLLERVGVTRVDEGRRYPEPRKGLRQDVRCAPVEVSSRDDVTALAHERGDTEMERCHAACGADRADATLERSDPFLQNRGGRIRDARVDVARFLEVEKTGRMVGVIEHERRRPVHGNRPRAGLGVGLMPCMQTQSGKTKKVGLDHQTSYGRDAW